MWEPVIGEELQCEREPEDGYAVNIKTNCWPYVSHVIRSRGVLIKFRRGGLCLPPGVFQQCHCK